MMTRLTHLYMGFISNLPLPLCSSATCYAYQVSSISADDCTLLRKYNSVWNRTGEHFLYGFPSDLPQTKLPMVLVLVQYNQYLVNLDSQKHTTKQLKSEISDKVLEELGGIGMPAGIPMQKKKAVHTKVMRILSTCLDQARRMKPSRRESAESILTERQQLNVLFEIVSCPCFRGCKTLAQAKTVACKCPFRDPWYWIRFLQISAQ